MGASSAAKTLDSRGDPMSELKHRPPQPTATAKEISNFRFEISDGGNDKRKCRFLIPRRGTGSGLQVQRFLRICFGGAGGPLILKLGRE
jgi:hypothetical protein